MTDALLRRQEVIVTHSGKNMWRCRSGGPSVYEPRGESSEENNPAGTLDLDFQPPELEGTKLFHLVLPVYRTLLWWPYEGETMPVILD